jgi:hypothetical protein
LGTFLAFLVCSLCCGHQQASEVKKLEYTDNQNCGIVHLEPGYYTLAGHTSDHMLHKYRSEHESTLVFVNQSVQMRETWRANADRLMKVIHLLISLAINFGHLLVKFQHPDLALETPL